MPWSYIRNQTTGDNILRETLVFKLDVGEHVENEFLK